MRDPARIDALLEKLGRIWKTSPDMRLGQLMYYFSAKTNLTDPFYLEDDVLIELLDRELKEIENSFNI
jgi:uncharacterized protein YihD (DUF1040 family)